MMRARTFANTKMRDTLQIGAPSGGSFGSDPGDVTYTYDSVNPVQCIVDNSISQEVEDGTQATITDAVIRVPDGTLITSLNRVKVTHRFREALGTAEIYRVLGEPKLVAPFLEVNCARVVGVSSK